MSNAINSEGKKIRCQLQSSRGEPYIPMTIIENYSIGQWLHSHGDAWVPTQLSLLCGREIALEGRGNRPSPSHTEQQLQINPLQQQPLCSPATTRPASTRNQPANSFRSELNGEFKCSALWLWYCVMDRHVWIQGLMQMSHHTLRCRVRTQTSAS